MIRLAFGLVSAFRVRRRATHILDEEWLVLSRDVAMLFRLRTPVEMHRSNEVHIPVTCGFFRSAVILPGGADGWSNECRRAVLLHEVAHIKRGDCQTQTLAQMICALYWFNPLVWWVAKRMRIERELACDDQVLGRGTKATEYAGHLVEIAKAFRLPERVSFGMAAFARSQLESRVRSILDSNIDRRHLSKRSVAWGSAAMTSVVLLVTAFGPRRSVAFTSNSGAIVEVSALLTTTPNFVGTNSKSEPKRARPPAVRLKQVVATDGKATAKQLMATSTPETRVGVSVSSSSSSVSSSRSQSTSATTPGVTTYPITRSEVTVAHGSERGFGRGLGQGFGGGSN